MSQDQLDELEELLRGDGVEDDNDSESSMQQTQTGRKLVSMSHFEKTVASLQTEVKEVYDQQVNMADRFQHDLSSIKSLLKEMIFQQQQQPLHTGDAILHVSVYCVNNRFFYIFDILYTFLLPPCAVRHTRQRVLDTIHLYLQPFFQGLVS